MPGFTDPFIGNVQKQMNQSELVRAIMLNIAAELEAVHIYTAHADATDDQDAKKILLDIAEEELVHAGEFTSLLYRLDPTAGTKAQEGFGEVAALLGSQAPTMLEAAGGEAQASDGNGTEPPVPHGLTVGSLMGI